MIEKVSTIVPNKIPIKHKGADSLTISFVIGDPAFDKALLELRANVYLLPDENHQGNTIKTSSDPLHIHGLIEKIWIENAIQDARHHELGLKRRQGIVGIIQVIGQPNTQVVSNAERSNSE